MTNTAFFEPLVSGYDRASVRLEESELSRPETLFKGKGRLRVCLSKTGLVEVLGGFGRKTGLAMGSQQELLIGEPVGFVVALAAGLRIRNGHGDRPYSLVTNATPMTCLARNKICGRGIESRRVMHGTEISLRDGVKRALLDGCNK
jgi:hypothetical protein